jgi:hypothetical protein
MFNSEHLASSAFKFPKLSSGDRPSGRHGIHSCPSRYESETRATDSVAEPSNVDMSDIGQTQREGFFYPP